MKTIITLLLTIFFLSSLCLAGWERYYGGDTDDWGYSAHQTTEGGYIITGVYDLDYYFDNGRAYLIKTDSSGDTLWTRTYGGSYWTCGFDVQQTSDGGYIIVGTIDLIGSSPYGIFDIYMVKTDAFGDTLWTRTYGGSSSDTPKSVLQTPDDGYIITGSTHSYGEGGADVYIIRTDAFGDTLWTRTYGGSFNDNGLSIIHTIDGGYMVAGIIQTLGGSNREVYLIKTDADGDSLWTRTYGGDFEDRAYSVRQLTDGGYVVCGWTQLFDSTAFDIWLIKTDSLGDTIWTRTYGGDEEDLGYSVLQTPDDGFIIAGSSESFYTSSDVYLIKTNAYGDTLWTRTYGGGYTAHSIAPTSDGGFIVCGYSNPYDYHNHEVYLIKTDSLGYTAIEENDDATRPEVFEISAYPNPFNSAVRIIAPENAEVEVFDIEGRKIGGLPGGESVWKPEESLGSGIYLVRATIGEHEVTKRVVYLK